MKDLKVQFEVLVIPYFILFCLGGIFLFINASEVIALTPATAEKIAKYPFGTEGSFIYRSPEIYLMSCVFWSCMELQALISSFIFFRLRKVKIALFMIFLPFLLGIGAGDIYETAFGAESMFK